MLEPLSTPKVRKSRSENLPEGAGYGRTVIFAVNEELDVHVARDSDRALGGAVKHETLFHNAPVLAAGEMCIEEGVVMGLNDFSGSYDTDGELEVNPAFAGAVLKAFEKRSLPMGEALREFLQNMTTT
ncbi:MAG: hypothetical protein ACLQU3_00640 [Limisphaerales bacterium]